MFLSTERVGILKAIPLSVTRVVKAYQGQGHQYTDHVRVKNIRISNIISPADEYTV